MLSENMQSWLAEIMHAYMYTYINRWDYKVYIMTVGSAEAVDNSTERMENISESITLPVQETGSQGRSQLCLNAKCYTTLPDGIVTVQLPRSLPSRQHDKKVVNSLELYKFVLILL